MGIELKVVEKTEQKKDITSIYNISIPKIKGDDVLIFNAFCKAVAAVNFVNFVNNYSEFLTDFFDKIEVVELKTGNKHLLKHYYKKIDMAELRAVYDYVLEARKTELEPFLQNKQQTFTEITDYEKIFYKMLFVYGDKLGGYTGLIALNPFEVVKIADFFRVLEEEKNEHLETLKKNRG